MGKSGATYYQRNKERILAQRRSFYQRNKEKASRYCQTYYQRNKERILAQKALYRQKNRLKLAMKQREYYRNNKEKANSYQRTYRQKNREKRASRRRERLRNDPKYAMTKRLRARMYAAVKKAGLKKKCDSTSKLLGISYQGLEEWMSSQFTEGMSWENRSEWHIDHRIPCDAFDLTVPEQQRICFWYKNLQPLWGPENMSKSNTYDEADKQALIAEYFKERI